MKLLFTVLIYFISVYTTVAQEASLMINYQPNLKIDQRIFEDNYVKVTVYSMSDFHALVDTNIAADAHIVLNIKHLKEDTVIVHLFSSIDISNDPDFSIDYSFEKNRKGVVLENFQTTEIKIVYPDTCHYFENIYNNRCPKCNNNDKTVRTFWRDPIYLHRIKDGEKSILDVAHWIEGTKPHCAPSWFCKRDKTLF